MSTLAADLADCCAQDGLLDLDAVLARLPDLIGPLGGSEDVPLDEALGRVLAEDVNAPFDIPRHADSAMDGYAVFCADLDPEGETKLPLGGRIAAGHVLEGRAERGFAYRIFTGAPLPEGPDAVIMQEHVRSLGKHVLLPPGVKPGANIRPPGNDVPSGARVLGAGLRLRPQDVAMAAAVGRARLPVRRPLRAAVFSTGDELQTPGESLRPGCIYDSNRHGLKAMLRTLGCHVTDLGILADRPELIREALAGASRDHDLLITTGGVSVGEEDHVKAVVGELGAIAFWRLALKPGKPVAMGHVNGTVFIGLPGNPVSALATFLLVARPVILRLQGCSETGVRAHPVRAAFSFSRKAGRREFLRARLEDAAQGLPRAHKIAGNSSGALSSMVAAEGLLDIPAAVSDIREGDTLRFLSFKELLG